MNRCDTNTRSYQIALESFSSMALDQPVSDRLKYRSIAMEAVTGPDSGMVLDRLYKNVMARASINFGKIPESMGDLTKFSRYKTISDSLRLLDRQLSEYKIMELEQAHLLHDNIIRLREDFSYGFKVDSQFLKTTYNSMVYALCEMINLVDVIYVDMLKAESEGRHMDYKPYSDLLLVQNVIKFNDMVKTGEWSTMMLSIRKDAKNLCVSIDADDGSFMHTIAGIVGAVTIPSFAAAALRKGATQQAKDRTYNATFDEITKRANTAYSAAQAAGNIAGKARATQLGENAAKFATDAASKVTTPGKISDYTAAAGAIAKGLWNAKAGILPVGKIATVIIMLIGALLIIRGIVYLFFRGAYKLDDVLNDSENLLKAHIDNNADMTGTSKAPEKQKAMYDRLAGLQNTIRQKILKSDAEGRKMLRESNATDFSAQALATPAEPVQTTSGSDDFAIG